MAKQTTDVKRIFRSKKNKVLGGVCGGLADYFSLDPVLIRVIFVIALIVSFGVAAIAYLVAWVIIPQEDN